MKLWHDDIRLPPDDDMIWCRTNEKLLLTLRSFSQSGTSLSWMSLDHDMGGHDLDPTDPENIYVAGRAEQDGTKLCQEIVQDERLLNYLLEQRPRITIHSWNVYGSIRMDSILRHQGGLRRLTIKPFEVKR